jgi:hypothetical protein
VLAAVDRDKTQHIAVALDGENGVTRWIYAPLTPLEYRALVFGGTSIRDAVLKDRVFIEDSRSVGDAPERIWQISGADVPADVLPSPELFLPYIMAAEVAAEVQRSVSPPASSETEIQIDGAAVLDGGMISFEDLSNFAGRVQRLWHAIAGAFYEDNMSPPQKPAGQGFTPSTLLLAGTGKGSWVAKVRPTEERMFDILLSKYKGIIETANDNALDAELRHGAELYDALDSYMAFVSDRKLEILAKSPKHASFVGPTKAAHFVKYFDARRPPRRTRPQKREQVVGATFRMEGYFLGYMRNAKEFEFVGRDDVTYDGEVFDSALFPIDEALPLGSAHVFEAYFCPISKGDERTYKLLTFRELKKTDSDLLQVSDGVIKVDRSTGEDLSMVHPDPIGQIEALSRGGKLDAALDIVFDCVDDMLLAGRFSDVDVLLERVPVDRLDPAVLVGFLTITGPARKLLASRAAFVTHVLDQLRGRMDPEELVAVMRGLE